MRSKNVNENPTRKSVGLSIFLPRKAIKIPIHAKIAMKIYLLAMINFSSYPIENRGQAPTE